MFKHAMNRQVIDRLTGKLTGQIQNLTYTPGDINKIIGKIKCKEIVLYSPLSQCELTRGERVFIVNHAGLIEEASQKTENQRPKRSVRHQQQQ